MNSNLIYLDYNATTPVDTRVIEKTTPYFNKNFGNAASRSHPFGWIAKTAVDNARLSVANLLGATSKEIIWTSGATEATNLAIKGVFQRYTNKGNHIITAKTEHKAVLDVCEQIENQGGKITYLDVNSDGIINISDLEKAIDSNTIMVSIMWANNETGVLQPIQNISKICKQHSILFMTDATQIVGKIPIDLRSMHIDLLACSAHKMYGMKGVGALYIRNSNSRMNLKPQIFGGGHERGYRSGTLNVPGIVSMGAAAELLHKEMHTDQKRITALRDKLEKALLSIEETYLNGHPTKRMFNVCNISFKYLESEAIIAKCNQVLAVSTGSACTSASLEPSHVLMSMGRPRHMAQSSIRFSLGKYTTEEEIESTINLIKQGVFSLRNESPIWQMFKEGVDVDNLLN